MKNMTDSENNYYKNKIEENAQLIEYAAGDKLIEIGDTWEGLYLISSGIFAVTAPIGSDKNRLLYPVFKGIVMHSFPTGKFKAEINIYALSHGYAYFMPHQTFRRLLATDPTFAEMAGVAIERAFIALHKLLAAGRIEKASERIAAFIMLQDMIQPMLGSDADKAIEDRIPQKMLAEMMGVSRSYLNQVLKRLRKK